MERIKTTIALLALAAGAVAQNVDVIDIDTKSHGDKVYPTMYGAFFEEISHSGDGGLYAEMIQNRGFEEGVIPSGCTLENGEVWAPKKPCYTTDKINNWHIRWDADKKAMQGWSVTAEKGNPDYSITTSDPLNDATPHALCLNLSTEQGPVKVANKGYWGIAVIEGDRYKLSFYTNAKTPLPVQLHVSLRDDDGLLTDSTMVVCKPNGTWMQHNLILKAKRTSKNARLELTFKPIAVYGKKGDGEVLLDFVSLFPTETFNNRENGLRKDIAQYLVDMKPSFLRWPGGCILEGINMDNAVDWKKTLGDPIERPGEYDLWGYRNSYGFGYHEFLQFCEDTGIDPMYVCNAGMSCLFRGGDYVEGDSLQAMIEDCLNALDYAIGDKQSTYWGHQRALNGHPEPFPLRYVEVGNENVGPRYAEHFKLFRDAIRERYPQLQIICSLMFHPELPDCGDMDLFDPHYYENADWFYRAANIFDNIPAKYTPNIYIGEYAAGGANMYAALAEAAFLTGCERNGERIRMVSFAPLFQNIHSGTRHLICFDNSDVFGRSNYHIVKMFNENRPDYNLTATIKKASKEKPAVMEIGKIGLSTFGNDVEFRDFKVTTGQKKTQQEDFLSENPADDNENWSTEKDGNNLFLWCNNSINASSAEISFRMKKNSGKEACRVMFGGKDTRNFLMAELGSHQNESTIFGERKDGDYTNYFTYRNVEKIEQGKWYDVKVKVDGYHWQIYLDGRLVEDYQYDPALVRHYTVAGMDEAKGEVVVKLVNGENEPWQAKLKLKGMNAKSTDAHSITLSASSPKDENSISQPELITPKEADVTLTDNEITLPANSCTILRIKKQQ